MWNFSNLTLDKYYITQDYEIKKKRIACWTASFIGGIITNSFFYCLHCFYYMHAEGYFIPYTQSHVTHECVTVLIKGSDSGRSKIPVATTFSV